MSNAKITGDIITIKPYDYNAVIGPDDILHIAPNNTSPQITFSPAPTADDYKDCVIRIDGSQGGIEWVQIRNVDGVNYDEELRLREENILVKELYEEYKMAVILAHKGD